MLIAMGIVLVIALLLAFPVTVQVSYEKEFTVVVGYLFFRFRLLPSREKKKEPHREKGKQEKQEKKEPKSGKSEKKDGIREILKQKGPGAVLELLVEASKLAGSVLKRFFSHVRVREFDLLLVMASDDAAQTALRYADACAVGYPAAGILRQACRCRRFGISIVPDFQRSQPEARLRFRAGISLFFLLKETVSAAIRAAKLWQKFQALRAKPQTGTTPSGAKP